MCNMEGIKFHFLEDLTNPNFKKKWSNVKVKRLKYQHKEHITRNVQVKSQSSITNYSNVFNNFEE